MNGETELVFWLSRETLPRDGRLRIAGPGEPLLLLLEGVNELVCFFVQRLPRHLHLPIDGRFLGVLGLRREQMQRVWSYCSVNVPSVGFYDPSLFVPFAAL